MCHSIICKCCAGTTRNWLQIQLILSQSMHVVDMCMGTSWDLVLPLETLVVPLSFHTVFIPSPRCNMKMRRYLLTWLFNIPNGSRWKVYQAPQVVLSFCQAMNIWHWNIHDWCCSFLNPLRILVAQPSSIVSRSKGFLPLQIKALPQLASLHLNEVPECMFAMNMFTWNSMNQMYLRWAGMR